MGNLYFLSVDEYFLIVSNYRLPEFASFVFALPFKEVLADL